VRSYLLLFSIGESSAEIDISNLQVYLPSSVPHGPKSAL
jgi:hypothetical protein